MNTLVFDSQVLADGHLSCPEEFIHKKNVQFKVLVIFDDKEQEASDHDIEQATVKDASAEYLSQDELDYYLALDEI